MKKQSKYMRILPLMLLLLFIGKTHAGTNTEETDSDSLYLGALKAISEKRHDEAKAILSNLIEKIPQHAGAWLELAMLQCELGNKPEADRLFLKMKQSLPLTEEQLQKLDILQPKECLVRSAAKHISVSMEVGYDTNVNQGASNPSFIFGSGSEQKELILLPEYQPKADRFATLSANISTELAKDGTLGFAQVRARSYDTLTSYNTLAFAAGLERPWKWRDYSIKGTAMASILSLGGTLYQKQEIAQLRLTPPAKQSSPWRFSTIAAYTHVEYPTLRNFDGHTWELRGLASYEAEKFQLQGSIAYLADRAHANRLSGHREGYYGNLNLRRQLSQRTEMELGWSQQIWQSEEIYSPGLIDVARRQQTQTLRTAVNWYVTNNHALQLEFRATNNKENISILQYNSKTLQLSWQWQNF
ncbi:tetratricopeptide repeat protein [Undibacterium pigrum]|uniref:Tetratricopeptide repeat protein n=1 Tax=Undibacterium pigrum TaxID=401470 RepID=A0A318J4G8_9BURK|nr:tetratricopeptide repeat protein [Undibacterium pigrum]PXX38798.1 tetratricopeptide repeat protein [Undibacterium pigrum]